MNWQDKIYDGLIEGKTTGDDAEATGARVTSAVIKQSQKIGSPKKQNKKIVQKAVGVMSRVATRHGMKNAGERAKGFLGGARKMVDKSARTKI